MRQCRRPVCPFLLPLMLAAALCQSWPSAAAPATEALSDAERGATEAVQAYLEGGGDINVQDRDGGTLLHHAVQGNQLGVVRLLVDRGADVARARKDGLTPLLLAALQGHVEIVKYLLYAGVDLAVKDKKGRDAAACAELSGVPVLPKLIRKAQYAAAAMGLQKTVGVVELNYQIPQDKDTGINVVLDCAHQVLFGIEAFAPLIRDRGIRIVGSSACLDTILEPGRPVNVGLSWLEEFEPQEERVGLWRCPEFNVVITYQGDPNALEYTPTEIEALTGFVHDRGGGLLIVGIQEGVATPAQADAWSLNSLARQFGARVGPQTPGAAQTLSLEPDWTVRFSDADGTPVYAVKEYGRGRVAVISDGSLIRSLSPGPTPVQCESSDSNTASFLSDLIQWLSAGKRPVGGPSLMSNLSPENCEQVGSITVMYPSNQKPEIIAAVRDEMPALKARLESWIPSPAQHWPIIMELLGGGGGWASGQEIRVMASSVTGVLSIFAHEMAHCMGGPLNAKGDWAGVSPNDDLFSEAHAGWFQRKAGVVLGGEYDPNQTLTDDPTGRQLDLTTVRPGDPDQLERGWNKLWYIYQRLDERYGTTWYPRWVWVTNTRWQDTPRRVLSWDDVVENMSIAVGEDLFPLFRALGTSLTKDRYPQAQFQGTLLQLPVAPIAVVPGGPARVEAAGDYRQPLSPE